MGGDIIWENSSVKLLGMNIDRGLKMDKHIKDIYAKANHKLSVFSRMCSFLSLPFSILPSYLDVF